MFPFTPTILSNASKNMLASTKRETNSIFNILDPLGTVHIKKYKFRQLSRYIDSIVTVTAFD